MLPAIRLTKPYYIGFAGVSRQHSPNLANPMSTGYTTFMVADGQYSLEPNLCSGTNTTPIFR